MKRRKQRWSNDTIKKLYQLNYIERLRLERELLRCRVMVLERKLESFQKQQELERKIDKALLEMKEVAKMINEKR